MTETHALIEASHPPQRGTKLAYCGEDFNTAAGWRRLGGGEPGATS